MAEITEKQVYEAFGLGEQAQEIANPAPQAPTQQGEQAQEIADPAEAGANPEEDTQTAPTVGTESPAEPEGNTADGANADKPPLTPEQRRENAARRRQQEQQARQAEIDQAVQTALQQERDRNAEQMKDLFSRAGIKNTVTGEAITNMEQFEKWQQQFGESKLQQELQAGKLTPEALTAAIGNHPIVKQAQQLISQNAQAKQAEERAAAKAKIENEIAEIHELDASISTLEDLVQAPYWPELYAMTKKGYSIKDAHFLLNHKRLEEAKLEAARQQGMLNARGKNHMTTTTTPRGGGSVAVPAEELAIFRQINPGATDAEIQAYYNNYKKT